MPPKLSLSPSAFNVPTPSRRLTPNNIVDSHIHLWHRDVFLHPSFTNDYTIGRYRAVVASRSNLEHCVYVDSGFSYDWKDQTSGWTPALNQVAWISKAAMLKIGGPPDILSIVPWAPIPAGPKALETYLSRITEQSSGVNVISGFRYQVDSSSIKLLGTPEFRSGLTFLVSKGYLIEFALPSPCQFSDLNDIISCMDAVNEESDRPGVFVIDHLACADFNPQDPNWLSLLSELSFFPSLFIKLSGVLSQCDATVLRSAFDDYSQESRKSASATSTTALKRSIASVIAPILDAFGAERIIFGSNYPLFRPTLSSQANTPPLAHSSSSLSLSASASDVAAAAPPSDPSLSSSSTSDPPSSPEKERKEFDFVYSLVLGALVHIGIEGDSLDSIFATNASRIYQPVPSPVVVPSTTITAVS